MTKLQLSAFFILSCLCADAQIHQNTPYEQKKKIEYDVQTDSLLRSAYSWLHAYKIQVNVKNSFLHRWVGFEFLDKFVTPHPHDFS